MKSLKYLNLGLTTNRQLQYTAPLQSNFIGTIDKEHQLRFHQYYLEISDLLRSQAKYRAIVNLVEESFITDQIPNTK